MERKKGEVKQVPVLRDEQADDDERDGARNQRKRQPPRQGCVCMKGFQR